MSTYQFPRDNGDEADDRPRGRVVAIDAPTLIDIKVNGVTFGTVDPMRLKARALLDLERSKGALDLLRWCERYAGVRAADMTALENELGEMDLIAVRQLAEAIGMALSEGISLPKASGRR